MKHPVHRIAESQTCGIYFSLCHCYVASVYAAKRATFHRKRLRDDWKRGRKVCTGARKQPIHRRGINVWIVHDFVPHTYVCIWRPDSCGKKRKSWSPHAWWKLVWVRLAACEDARTQSTCSETMCFHRGCPLAQPCSKIEIVVFSKWA